MGLARTVHSRAELIALQAGPSDQPFWAHQPSACDEPDVVLVLVSGADLSAPTDVPPCGVAVLSESEVGRLGGGRTPPPAVADLGGAVRAISDGDLVLVDGNRGEVLVDPTDRAISAFQARQAGLMPAHRFFVDYAHEMVRTPEGRPIVVGGLLEWMGSAQARPDMRRDAAGEAPSVFEEAIGYGPDLVVVPVRCSPDLIGAAIPSIHGKPVMFVVHPEGCCEEALVRAAAWSDVTAAVSLRANPDAVAGLEEMLEATTESLIASGVETGRVRLAGWMREGAGDPEVVPEVRIERLIADMRERPALQQSGLLRCACNDVDGDDGCVSPWLSDTLAAARSVAVPVYVAVGPGSSGWAAEIVEAGVGGVIAPAAEVQVWKGALRAAAFAD